MNRTIFLVMTVSVWLACTFEGTQLYESAELAIMTGDPGSTMAPASSVTASRVERMSIALAGDDIYGIFQDPLIGQDLHQDPEGVWSTVLVAVPVGPVLSVSVTAVDGAGVELFTGSMSVTLIGSGDAIEVPLTPISAGEPAPFPRVAGISLPERIDSDSDVSVAVSAEGAPGETLEFSFSGGEFAPAVGSITLSDAGSGEIASVFSSPAAEGAYACSIRLINESGNWVTTEFLAHVIDSDAEVGVSVAFGPVVLSLGARRTGDVLILTAAVDDDGPVDLISFDWSFSGSLPFVDATSNPAVLYGYFEAVTGVISLEVQDSDALRTAVAVVLEAGQFPDALAGPIAPLVINEVD